MPSPVPNIGPMDQSAPAREPIWATPTPASQLEFPTFDSVQLKGACPPPMTDSPSITPRSARMSGKVSRVQSSDPQEVPLLPARGASTSGRSHDVRGGRAGLPGGSSAAKGARSASAHGGRRTRPNSGSQHNGAGFRDKLEALSDMHDMEVADLMDEVKGLQDLVVKYESLLNRVQDDYKRVRGEANCSTGDGAAMYDLMQEIAGEMSSGCLCDAPASSTYSPKHSDAAQLKHAFSGISQPKQTPSKVDLRISGQAAAVMPPSAARECKNNLNRRRKKIKGSMSNLGHRTWLQRIVDHVLFDLICTLMIVGNSVVIGFDVQVMTTQSEEPKVSIILGGLCSAFFLVELVLRVSADGLRWFFVHSENRNWNWFDFFLVAMSAFDILSFSDSMNGSDASSVGKGIKTIKMLRIVRVLRVFRFFTKLSQLAFMIIDSVKSLVWALIMLGIVIYVFAIFFTHYTAEYTRLQGNSANAITIAEHFGSLGMTSFTLFHCMLNGISWYTIPLALGQIPGWTGPFLAGFFLIYLSFTMLAVMNIITGVFVDNAVETARTQREFLVQKEMEVKEQWLGEMRNIFMEMDADGSGTVSKDEILVFVNDERVQYYLTALGLDVDDADRLFVLLDENRVGEIELDQFLAGCLRLKGSARSIDVCSLIHQSRQLCKRLEEIDALLHDFMGIRNKGSAWLMPPLNGHKNGLALQDQVPDKTP